jgi:hypothetical protein
MKIVRASLIYTSLMISMEENKKVNQKNIAKINLLNDNFKYYAQCGSWNFKGFGFGWIQNLSGLYF